MSFNETTHKNIVPFPKNLSTVFLRFVIFTFVFIAASVSCMTSFFAYTILFKEFAQEPGNLFDINRFRNMGVHTM